MKTLQKMYEHIQWANHRLLDYFQTIDQSESKAMRLFAHILHAEDVWLTRLEGNDSSKLSLWSDADVQACSELAARNEERFTSLFSELINNTRNLDDIVVYANSKGQKFETSIRDILTHVALHGQYHRGQVNTKLREDEFEPVNVDFITYVR